MCLRDADVEQRAPDIEVLEIEHSDQPGELISVLDPERHRAIADNGDLRRLLTREGGLSVIGPLVRRKQRHRRLGVGGPVDGSKVQHAFSIASRDAWIDVLSGGWLESTSAT